MGGCQVSGGAGEFDEPGQRVGGAEWVNSLQGRRGFRSAVRAEEPQVLLRCTARI
jgi:hypothetical protein